MTAKGGALKCLADHQALEHATVQGRGGIHLEQSHPQLAALHMDRTYLLLRASGFMTRYPRQPTILGFTQRVRACVMRAMAPHRLRKVGGCSFPSAS